MHGPECTYGLDEIAYVNPAAEELFLKSYHAAGCVQTHTAAAEINRCSFTKNVIICRHGLSHLIQCEVQVRLILGPLHAPVISLLLQLKFNLPYQNHVQPKVTISITSAHTLHPSGYHNIMKAELVELYQEIHSHVFSRFLKDSP